MPLSSRSPQFRIRIALLLTGAAVVYLIGNNSVGLWDRDEPRYAQTSRQMLQSGDWVVPRFLDEVRTAKPPLIYWCQASAMKVFGDDEFAARFPSALAMLLAIAILASVLSRVVGRRRAIWSAFILATAVLSIAAAKMCLTDGVLLLFVTIAQICFFLVLNRRANWITWIMLGITIGFAGLTKGPVVLGVLGTTWIVYRFVTNAKTPFDGAQSRHAGWASFLPRVFVCAIIVSAIVLPWMILISQRSPGFLSTTFRHDIIARATSGLEGHKLPPGFYLASIWITFLPWSILLPITAAFAWKRMRQARRDPLIGFCFAAVVGPWVMFEIVQTKLPFYILPILPPLAVLTARAICLRSARFRRAAISAGAITLALVLLVYGIVLPRVQVLRTSQNIAAILRDNGATHLGDAIMIDYKEPSLAFAQGGTIREESDNKFLANVEPARWPKFIVLTRRVWDESPQKSRDQLEVVGEARGFWYVKGAKMVDVLVVKKR